MTKKNKKPSIVPGIILIFIGVVAILTNFDIINPDWEELWTYIIIILGVVFWLGFIFDRSKDGLIMPGTILLTYGIIFNLSARFAWADMEDLWPFFILGPAFGFYAMYIFGRRDRGILVPATILTIVGGIFLLNVTPQIKYVWPPLVVVIGVLMLLRNRNREPEDME